MKRRQFLMNSLAASAFVGLSGAAAKAADSQEGAKREYYELRVYRVKKGGSHELLDGYLEKAAIPALNRLGAKTVGVFTEIEPKEGPSVFVLIPYPNIEVLATAGERLRADADFHREGASYLQTPKDKPGFERIDSWLMSAFAGMPRIELPSYSKEKRARIFELRTYESYSEMKAAKKVEMFNSGEIDVMRETGLGPVFYGSAMVGRDLPHLTYMLSAENLDDHKKHWGAFGSHPTWKKMSSDPQYADTVSTIRNWMLAPTSYSQV